jgi:hypothetical protein
MVTNVDISVDVNVNMRRRKNMKRMVICIAVIFGLFCPSLFGQEASLRNYAGTVELKAPGSSVWVPAKNGAVLTGKTMISTGFRSTAVLDLGASSIMVHPLTRLTLEELSKLNQTEQIQIILQSGRIRANITPPAGGKTRLTVTSPIATASVRGTVFYFDTVNLSVNEGTVEFSGARGGAVLVDAGDSSFVEESAGRAAPPQDLAAGEINPEPPIGTPLIPVPIKPNETIELRINTGF